MGAICNPLFQNKLRMVESGLCTDSQYDYGVTEIVDCVDCALGYLYVRKHVIVVSYHNKVNNEWYND